MPNVHVNLDPLAVYAIVGLIGIVVVIALVFSFFGARINNAPR